LHQLDPEAMAQAVMDDDRPANQLARRVCAKYDWNKMVEDYVRLFHDVYNNQ